MKKNSVILLLLSLQTANIFAMYSRTISSGSALEATKLNNPDQLKHIQKAMPELLEETDVNGRTILHLATFLPKPPIAMFILGQPELLHALINKQDNANRTALHNAALNGDTEMIKLLITAGAISTIPDINNETARQLYEKQHKQRWPLLNCTTDTTN